VLPPATVRANRGCSRCIITRLPPESTMTMATGQLFFRASASAAAIAFFA
jgi:hypothetical protein